MPTVNPGETQKEFIPRCIETVIKDGSAKDREQAAAMCYSMWRQARGKSIEPNVRREFVVDDARLKAKAVDENDPDDAGWIEGYSAVYGKVYEDGDQFMPGCFAKSISERVPAGRVKLTTRHYAYGGDALDVIGTVTEAKEDEYGLWFHAELDGSPESQSIRRKVLMGVLNSNSVGYSLVQNGYTLIDRGDGNVGYDYTEAKWLENTVTVRPVEEGAVMTAAKGDGESAPEGRATDADAGAVRGETESLDTGGSASRHFVEDGRRYIALQRSALVGRQTEGKP